MALGRPLLWCACRHHILELIAKFAFGSVFTEKSTCPGERICNELSNWWEKQESVPRDFSAENRPQLFCDDDPFDDCLDDLGQLSATARTGGKKFQRGDYDELLEL